MDATAILHQARTAVEVLAARLTDVLRELPTASAPVSPEWTVREAAAHLVSGTALYAELAAGATSPILELTHASVSEYNSRRLADIADTEPGALAKALEAAVDQFSDATGGRPGDAPIRWHGGLELELAHLAGILVGEYLLHGYDIAAAVGAAWPINIEHVALVGLSARSTLPVAVDPATSHGHTADYLIDLGVLGRSTMRFVDGAVSIVPCDGAPVDCVITADPVAFLLVRRRRLSQAAAIALGLLRFEGPRPELGPNYFQLFRAI